MKLAGVNLTTKIILNHTDLYLNGAAVRSKFFIQTYIISFYTEKSITSMQEAVYSTIARSLRMQIITPLATSKAVSENIQNGMKESLGNVYNNQKELIEDLRYVIETSNVQHKDVIDIFYAENVGLKLYKNETEIYHNQDGKLFAETIFGMYVGDKPKDKKIKEALLKGF